MRRLGVCILFIASLYFVPSTAMAQSRTVSGKVSDSEGAALPGVLVKIKDGSGGTVTDAAGTFRLGVPNASSVLVFTYLGMDAQEVRLSSGQTSVNVKMIETANRIEQVVVTGYTQTTTKRMTGSVGVLSAEAFDNKPLTSVDAILQGQLAGVAVTATSGQPGKSQNIRIRGTNTITSKGGNAAPLWVVDGVPLQGGEKPDLDATALAAGGFADLFVNGVAGINPNDIENVSVLKDAAAAAIYGSRASNGVIVITTKRGTSGKARVNYSANVSVTLMPQRADMLMNSSEKLAWEQELWDEFSAPNYAANLADPSLKLRVPVVGVVGMIRKGVGQFASMQGDVARQDAYIAELGKRTTNWFNEIFRHAVSTNHHVSLSGGGNLNNYYVSLGYTLDKGLLRNDGYNRYSVLANYTMQPHRIVKLDFGIDITNQTSKSPNLADVDPFSYAYYANPYERPYNDDGSLRSDLTYRTLGMINGDSFSEYDVRGYNIIRELDNTSSETGNWKTNGRLNAELTLAPTLKLVGLFSYTFDNNKTTRINLKDTYAAFDDRFETDTSAQYIGSLTENVVNKQDYIARAHLAYTENYGTAHTLSVIGGAEIRSSDSKTVFRKGYRYDPKNQSTSVPPPPSDKVSDNYLRAINNLSGHYFNTNRFASFYLSADYFLLNRYVFNVSARADGSSYFGTKRQFSPTWSAGAAWHIAEESFMKGTRRVLDHLVLRVASGFTGNVNTYATPYLIMSYRDQEYRRVGTDDYYMGWFAGAPNPNLRWEKTFDSKVSLDFGLFGERLSGLVEAYYKKTTDVVENTPIPAMVGYTSQRYNSVDILNSGIEATLRGVLVASKQFRLTASVNFSYNANVVTKLIDDGRIDTSTRYLEGYPVSSIFTGKLLGIDEYTGLYEFKRRSDAVFNSVSDLQEPNNYRFYLGTSEAPYTGGFNIDADYKGVSLSILGVYSWGSKSFENLVSPASSSSMIGDRNEIPQTGYNDLYTNHLNVLKDRTDRWREPYDGGHKYPRIVDAYGEVYNFAASNPMAGSIVSGAYLKDNSFVRIKSIIVGFDFPQDVISKAHMASLKMNISLNNFFTFTNYDGLDPETPGALYPISRSVTFGMSIGF